MAKNRHEVENPILTPLFPFRSPSKAPVISYTRCGCGKPAVYEVYEDRQPHCTSCFDEAADTKSGVLVRRLNGGYDDAS